jgi:large subunit ribosomal protein L4
MQSKSTASLEVSDELFAVSYKPSVIHQVMVAYQAAARAGTKQQKTRAEVSGGGAKPFKQKGTGRARAGTTRGPIWRSGGVTFAARPQDHSQKVNKKVYRLAVRSIISELLRSKRLIVVDALEVENHKTKAGLALLQALNINDSKKVLFVLDEVSETFYLALRNLYYVGLCDAQSVDPLSLVRFETVVMTAAAVRQLEERLL